MPGLVARVKNDRKKLMGKLVQEWGRYLFRGADREGQNCAINQCMETQFRPGWRLLCHGLSGNGEFGDSKWNTMMQ